MLIGILCGVGPQITIRIGAWRVIRNRVELVITHDRKCGPGVNHGAHDFDHLALEITAVDKVTQKDRSPRGMAVDPGRFLVAKLVQQGLQAAAVAVYVADNVLIHPDQSRIPIQHFQQPVIHAYPPTNSSRVLKYKHRPGRRRCSTMTE